MGFLLPLIQQLHLFDECVTREFVICIGFEYMIKKRVSYKLLTIRSIFDFVIHPPTW
jgi:hypothetical protein